MDDKRGEFMERAELACIGRDVLSHAIHFVTNRQTNGGKNRTPPTDGRAKVSRHKTVSNPHRTTVTRGGRQLIRSADR